MYIYPNSTLYILHNVNLNKDYDHTIYFPRADYQQAFFLDSSKIKYQLDNQSYMRMERGWLKVNKNQNDLWDCTYIIFKNTSYGSKYFYAFINSVEYINDQTSKINFEIDEIQTWWFDYSLEKCFVEREHTLTDNLFENTVDENLDSGDSYYLSETTSRWLFGNTRLLMICTASETNTAEEPRLEKNVFTGLRYRTYDLTDPVGLDLAINKLKTYIANGFEDDVITIMQYPSFIGQLESDVHGYEYADRTFTPNFTTIDGYTPKNKKLFCFPYNYLSISDKEGSGKEYKWELWNTISDVGKFRIEGCGYGKPVVQVVPRNYRSISASFDGLDYDNALIYDNFPICPWAGDSFQVWLAQNKATRKNELGWSLFSGGVSIALGLLTQQPATTIRGAQNILGTITSQLASKKDKENIPNKVHGDVSTSLLNIQNETSGFELKQMTVKAEYAQILDEYFSKFGYACHRIKVPNRYARTNWTYTKTVGCEITGNLPSDSADKIKSIYDHGITFWANGNNIGNYGDFTNGLLSH